MVAQVLHVIYLLCPLSELYMMHVMCMEVVQHVLHVVHVLRMMQLLFAEDNWYEAPGACMLNVLGVFGVVTLLHARHTVEEHVAHVALAVCQVMLLVVHNVYVRYTLPVLHCPMTVSFQAYCVGIFSWTFFVCCWMSMCDLVSVSIGIV
jgi:hypothetical protein